MQVHLVDGTYELFRHFFAVPPQQAADGAEVGAMLGVMKSLLYMLEDGATHVGVATDHVIESFRNDLWAGYKTGDGIEPALHEQFVPLEAALRAMGVTVWAMIDQEADDALCAAARVAAADDRVERAFICTPDKDLAQCVGGKIVQLDRRKGEMRDADGVAQKFGVPPASIPDYLALVGDSADGFPGVPRWGAKSAAAILSRYGTIEQIPDDVTSWDVKLRGAASLAASLTEHRDEAALFKVLATLRDDADVGTVDDWRWTGPTEEFEEWCDELGAPEVAERARAAADGRS